MNGADQQIHFCTGSDGVRIAYARTGKGPPLVRAAHWLTHIEFDRTSLVWRHWIAELSRHYGSTRPGCLRLLSPVGLTGFRSRRFHLSRRLRRERKCDLWDAESFAVPSEVHLVYARK